mgnify:FL=1
MVTERIEEPAVPTEDTVDTGVSEVEAPVQAEIPADEATVPEEQPAPAEEQAAPVAETPAGTPPTETLPFSVNQKAFSPQPAQMTPEQIAKAQQDAIQYEQVQAKAALQNQSDMYKRQLEAQGFLPEHADQAANAYMQSQQQQQTLMKQAEAYGQHIQGKQVAAEHFVKKYNLGIDDLTALRAHEDPASMENAAKTLSQNRQRDAELAALKQARVPPQNLDNSQGSPEVAADEGGWLDRYNAGDRSSNAVTAARKAAGLQ